MVPNREETVTNLENSGPVGQYAADDSCFQNGACMRDRNDPGSLSKFHEDSTLQERDADNNSGPISAIRQNSFQIAQHTIGDPNPWATCEESAGLAL